MGLPFRTVFPDLDGPEVADRLDAAFRGEPPFRTNEQRVQWRSPDGIQREMYLRLLIEATQDSDGAIRGLVFYGWDVPERIELRRRAQALPVARVALIEQVPVGIIFVDADGRPEVTNALAR